MKTSNITVGLVLALWAACVASAFWHYDWRYLRPVPRPLGAAAYAFSSAAAKLPETPLAELHMDVGRADLQVDPPVTLLNFWSPTCGCSRFMEAHVRDLVRDFRSRGVRFIAVVESGTGASEQSAALESWRARKMPNMPVVLDAGGGIARSFGVWAAPGAVIMNRHGRIEFVGSYNTARFCADAATAWAMQALQAILVGRQPPHRTTPFYGCQVTGRRA